MLRNAALDMCPPGKRRLPDSATAGGGSGTRDSTCFRADWTLSSVLAASSWTPCVAIVNSATWRSVGSGDVKWVQETSSGSRTGPWAQIAVRPPRVAIAEVGRTGDRGLGTDCGTDGPDFCTMAAFGMGGNDITRSVDNNLQRLGTASHRKRRHN